MRTPDDLWREFCLADPGISVSEPYQVWYFGNNKELAESLCGLVIQGRKTATSALVWEAEADPGTAPVPDGYSIITDFHGEPQCVIRTTGVRTVPFDEVDAEFAFDEGEGDQSLDYWRQVHWDYFSARCAELGKTPDLKMPVICERFALLYPRTLNASGAVGASFQTAPNCCARIGTVIFPKKNPWRTMMFSKNEFVGKLITSLKGTDIKA